MPPSAALHAFRALPLVAGALALLAGADADPWTAQVRPLVQRHCVDCHGADTRKGDLDLARFAEAPQVLAEPRTWALVLRMVEDGRMPPSRRKEQPTVAERARLAAGVHAMLRALPPPATPARRLSRAEYDRSIRDLTGVDMGLAGQTFPDDPSGGEGFTNAGEALAMPTELFERFLGAARGVAARLVPTANGVIFAAEPAGTPSVREAAAVARIERFYRRHGDVDLVAHLVAAWRVRDGGEPGPGVSQDYARGIAATLADPAVGTWFADLAGAWRALPRHGTVADPRAAVAPIMTSIARWQALWPLVPTKAVAPGKRMRSQPHADLALRTRAASRWFRAETLADRVDLGDDLAGRGKDPVPTVLHLAVLDAGDGAADDVVVVEAPAFALPGSGRKPGRRIPLADVLAKHDPAAAQRLGFGRHPAGAQLDAASLALRAPAVVAIPIPRAALGELKGARLELPVRLDAPGSVQVALLREPPPTTGVLPGAMVLTRPATKARAAYAAAIGRLADAFPNGYRADSLLAGSDQPMMFQHVRDDEPLRRLVLDAQRRAEIDALWADYAYAVREPERIVRNFLLWELQDSTGLGYFHGRQEFLRLRTEDPAFLSTEHLAHVEAQFAAFAAKSPTDGQLALAYVRRRIAEMRAFQAGEAQARERHLAALADLAARAWRHAADAGIAREIRAGYDAIVAAGAEHEEALRQVVIGILTSPRFLYLAPREVEPGRPYDDWDLAGRLSTFLWSSLPDERLRALAAAGKLRDPAVLVAEALRMLDDERIAALGAGFFGEWLGFAGFERHQGVDRERFPQFTGALQAAMAEEPLRFAVDLLRRGRPLGELLDADWTWVDPDLARHYGLQYPKVERGADPWQRVEGLRAAGRGGILGMGAFLTRNSPGARTSPVKRGVWVVEQILGEHLPMPPADVPDLPDDEAGTVGLTMRQLVERHVADQRCADCHRRIDPVGMAFEGFDPIGRRRGKDLAGRPIDDRTTAADGTAIAGLAGLREYLALRRRDEVLRTLCRRLLGYALGRATHPADEALLARMRAAIEPADAGFAALVRVIVASAQFRCRPPAGATKEKP